MPRPPKNLKPKITLAGALPAGPLDGLTPLYDELMNNPLAPRLAVTMYVTGKRTEDLRKDVYYPVVYAVQIECPADPADVKLLGEIMGRSLAARTGLSQLPFEPASEFDWTAAAAQAAAAADSATG